MSIHEPTGTLRPAVAGHPATLAGRPALPAPRRPADEPAPARRPDGAPPALELVTDRARPAVPGQATGTVPITLEPGTERRLTEVSREHGVAPSVVLLAAYALTLGRHAGTDDVSVGTDLRGDLAVLRTRWADDPTFARLLERVRDADAHPAGTDAARLGRHPLFQTASAAACTRADLALAWDQAPDQAGRRHGRVDYDPELFDQATAARLATHHLALLEAALAAPGTPVSHLDHTTADERARLTAWGTTGGTPHPHGVVELFLARAEATPDAVALVFDDQTLTYAQLRERAERLARILTAHGVGAEHVVGLAMQRSAALVTAMLAVLLAGGAYLPLDPGHPDARLSYMAADSRARLVLADRDLVLGDVPVLRVDRDATPPAQAWTRPPVHPDQRACVLYTSGSTGRPKGVEVTHRGIVRLVHQAEFTGLGPDDAVAQVANVSFDAATFEIWGALLNGARLVGVPKDEAITPDLLGARVAAHGITAMLLTTVVLHRCVDEAPQGLAPLRVLYYGGEAADPRRVAALRAVAPHLRLVNAYGPTECTTIATTSDNVGTVPGEPRAPIGRPIAQTTAYVLDGRGRTAGIGVPGELHLGGPGLARGYLGRPDLTAERFVPSPFGHGERLYRTGDVVRWREDGELEYLGRADDQVKIRGVRIEPDEIAAVLATCPRLRAAVVDVRGDGDAKRLVAYVVPDEPGPVDRAGLRAYVADRLPDAMVPTFYVAVPQLPITPNGKVDRQALPAPTAADAVSTAYVAPAGPAEELVARVWAELLDLDRVSAHDDFFALGGHSLLATRAVARIAAALGVTLNVRDLFEAPTVGALAARAATGRPDDDQPPIGDAGDGPYRLSFAQQRLWFLDQLAPGSPLYNVPLVLTLAGALDVPALDAAVRALACRHAALRTRLVARDGEPVQVVDPDSPVRVTVEDLRHLPEPDRRQAADDLARQEAERPFDLAAGPLLRVRLLRLAAERFELLLTMHHAVSDGWSVGVVIDDLAAAYTAARAGGPADLPAPSVRYADYAHWQRELLDSGVREQQLGHWRAELAGAPPLLELPTDRPRPPVPRHVGDAFPIELPPGLSRRLDEVSRAHGATRFMTLLTVYQLLLGRYADCQDVSVGSPVAGRTRPELADLVGFFVNTLVLRTRWADDPTFAELLARVRRTTLAAYAHQDVPFDQVVEALKPPRDPSRTPLFQAMLAMQDVPTRVSALDGLAVTVRESTSRIAKFDLTVAWDEASLADGELRGSVEYDVDLFDRGTVEALAGHYLTLLDAALAAPHRRVSQLPLVREEEVAALVADLDAPAAPPRAALVELFDAAAARWPDRDAVTHDGHPLTYADLAARADRLARSLRERGVRPGDTVAVRLDRGPLWPVALLAVLKAGAAYVPVDAGAPKERFAHLLADSGAALVLGDRAAGAPPAGPVPWHAVEDLLEGPVAEAPLPVVSPAAPAYVLYTSGTTGRPKGVCVSQGNLGHTLRAVADRYELSPEDRVLQFAALTFDVAAEELFSALIRGACVVLLPSGPVPGIAELAELVRQERLTVLNLPASYWHEWVGVLAQHPPSRCPSLRLVVVGSERVDGGRLARWQAVAPTRPRWLNAYGPTEATITATVHEPAPGTGGPATVPIGRPLPGVRAYVLDTALRPVPAGVPGDLYLAGPGVADGYLGDPARTATAFLPDPWGPPGGRMYATGDRARRTADGVLEFLGRDDHQVKLRGFRIELGEIESALASCPGVREAAVLLHEDAPGGPTLVGYLAPPVAEAAVRAHLADRLPAYMVPSTLVSLDRLPTGASGKLDRRALPAPTGPARTGHAVPTGELERTVAEIWCDVLGVDRVDAEANFFELGGHSLLIVRVQARLSETLGRPVPVVDLFRFPTVRALAQHLTAGATPASGTAGRRRAEARKLHQGGRVPRRRATPETLENPDE
ncbi:amino acid adenylation domain-containing protein [Catellatospora sp. KI3]|uniref:non-ribosomal peptide synthetase n=1 Tax=Catellatospora sp. KI3 TaxID=3041620 RepID=UPI0024824D2F|nr:non-ribosomal peptide synthetase [Catellatospora sp. KI3]MDI1463733.1 amino acid adenylation domain-containing protein [Catellatospora sp. KI3]